MFKVSGARGADSQGPVGSSEAPVSPEGPWYPQSRHKIGGGFNSFLIKFDFYFLTIKILFNFF